LVEERVPFQVTAGAVPYDAIGQLPVTVLLDNFRSLYNVGAVFRTADATAVERLLLCGITGRPEQKGVAKTALGAEQRVAWEPWSDPSEAVAGFRNKGYEIAVLETSVRSVDLFDWVPAFPVLLVLGNEVDGVTTALVEAADTHVRIPMLGTKHSLNVATAAGVALYELLRKYRDLQRRIP
jgi:tRNA G18 (ribose-2'-O)-methylase SpoU